MFQKRGQRTITANIRNNCSLTPITLDRQPGSGGDITELMTLLDGRLEIALAPWND